MPASHIGSTPLALRGGAIFCTCLLAIDKLTPCAPWGEIAVKRHIARAIVVAAMGGAIGRIGRVAAHG